MQMCGVTRLGLLQAFGKKSDIDRTLFEGEKKHNLEGRRFSRFPDGKRLSALTEP
jgi:hypothetical protein